MGGIRVMQELLPRSSYRDGGATMYIDEHQKPATHMARIVPTILLHFLHPWRSDVGRYDSKEGIGRVESGTETESNAYAHGWAVLG
jgi:hypothetical protein